MLHGMDDVALRAVVNNNILCINREHNIFDSKKRSKNTSNDALQHKLFSEQRRLMALNQALLYWHIPQLDICKTKVKSIMKEWPNCKIAQLISIAILLKEKKVAEGLQQLSQLVMDYQEQGRQEEPSSDLQEELQLPFIALQLNLMPKDSFQLALASNDTTTQNSPNLRPSDSLLHQKHVVDVIQKFISSQLLSLKAMACPAVLSLRLAAYAQLINDPVQKNKALKECNKMINESLEYHHNNSTLAYATILEKCGNFLYTQNCFKEASVLYEKMLEMHDSGNLYLDGNEPEDLDLARQAILGRMISAYARFDGQKAAACSTDIEFSDHLDVKDVDALETAFLFGAKYVKRLNRHAGSKDGETLADVTTARIEKAEKKKKKKRKIRMPKDAIPGVMPDPERWIPKRERTTYRGKRKDKKQNLRGPQGATSGAADWDVSTSQAKWNKSETPQAVSTGKHISAAARTQKRKGKRRGRN